MRFMYHLRASLVAQTVKNLPAVQETRFNPWVGKIHCRREWLPTLVFFPGEFHGHSSGGGLQSMGLPSQHYETNTFKLNKKAAASGWRRQVVERRREEP